MRMKRVFDGCIVVFSIAFLLGCGSGGQIIMVYPNFILCETSSISVLDSGGDNGGKIGDLWLKVSDSEPVHLSALTIEQLREWRQQGYIDKGFKTSHYQAAEGRRIDEFKGRYLTAIFEFEDGKLRWIRIDSLKEFQFSAIQAGPFASFPMTKEQAIASFGKPLRIKRAKPTAAP